MTERDSVNESKIVELEKALKEAREKALYFQWLAIKSGIRSVREIDQLSRIHMAEKEIEKALKYRIELDRLIQTISARFLDCNTDTLESTVEWTLGILGEFYNVDRSTIIRFTDDGTCAETAFEWSAKGIESGIEILPGRDTREFPLLDEMHSSRDVFVAPDTAEIEDRVLREHYLRQNILSLILVPMFLEDRCIGLLGFVSVSRKKLWNDEDIDMIRTITDILVNAIERKRIEDDRSFLRKQIRVQHCIDSLGTLAGGIVHDVNNLLATVKGNIDLLSINNDNMTAKQKEYLERASQDCRRAAKLIGEIQDFSRGAISEKATLDIYEIAHNAFDYLEKTSPSAIQLIQDIEPGIYRVPANADLLHQVFVNLGMNAVQAIEEKGTGDNDFIRFSAEVEEVEADEIPKLKPGKYVHMRFEDTGMGMTPDVISKAFDPLFSTKHGQRKGLGLGLALVYIIVTTDHGGHIRVESDQGKGTIFHIYLPDAGSSIPDKTVTKPEIASYTVLVVDDNKEVGEITKESLWMLGHRVILADSGTSALDIYREQNAKIDLVLLDMVMPDISGEEVLSGILEIKPETRIILMTGYGDEALKDHPRAYGCIAKPFTIDTLESVINDSLFS